ncbi:MAG TPA: tRNA (guanosine(46)-N7)-methyltransferase TrmB [Hanamia sp.]|jgi:tRNA (guanine-N7-)-methyltransferase|nr:tRNA (guanosine(46)-N7)-methyltransferase TrmB [Hanamia sp.]
MAQKKLQRFSEIKMFPNVLEYPENMKEKWKDFFKNNHPVVLELACGKGEYAIGLAQLYPQKNLIGVDIKGNRLWVGAKFALKNDLKNVAFLRTQIDKINQYFSKDEVDEIWITFPDPQLRFSKAKKRLTHPKFLRLYQQIIKPGAKIHLKTDSPDLYHFTKTVIKLYQLVLVSDINNVYSEENLPAELAIQTHYEKLDIANSNAIFYLCFSLPEQISEEDEPLHDILKEKQNEG